MEKIKMWIEYWGEAAKYCTGGGLLVMVVLVLGWCISTPIIISDASAEPLPTKMCEISQRTIGERFTIPANWEVVGTNFVLYGNGIQTVLITACSN